MDGRDCRWGWTMSLISLEVLRDSAGWDCDGEIRPEKGWADEGAELLWEYGGGG